MFTYIRQIFKECCPHSGTETIFTYLFWRHALYTHIHLLIYFTVVLLWKIFQTKTYFRKKKYRLLYQSFYQECRLRKLKFILATVLLHLAHGDRSLWTHQYLLRLVFCYCTVWRRFFLVRVLLLHPFLFPNLRYIKLTPSNLYILS